MLNLEEILKYNFKKKNILKLALTHASIDNKNSYERLEFIGDSILNFIISEHLFKHFKNDNESLLTIKRTQLINKKYLANISKCMQLKKHIIIQGDIEISDRIYCNIFEALIGAVYIDSNNLEKTKNIVIDLVANSNFEFQDIIDFKGELINYYNKKIITIFKMKTEKLLDSNQFVSYVNLNNNYFYGFAKNKLDAEQRASLIAFNHLNKIN